MTQQVPPLSDAEKLRIRLLSDGKLYQDALKFLDENKLVDGSQLQGLLKFSQSIEDLLKFIKHQKSRDWWSRKAHYGDFYGALDNYFKELNGRIKNEYGFIPDSLTKNEGRARQSLVATRLAREFIQHLVSESYYRDKISGR